MLKWIFLDTSRSTQGIPNQELLSRVASGPIAVTNGVIGSVANILSDLLLLLLLLVGLFIVSPLVTGVAVGFFGITAWILHKLVHIKSRTFGFQIFELTHSSSTKIVELFSSKRELWTGGRFDSKLEKAIEERKLLASKNLELSLLPNISKYFIESALLIGAAIFAGIEFFLSSATHALTALSVFLAAGSRIAPALLRLQQSGLVFASNVELADKSLADIARFQQASLESVLNEAIDINRDHDQKDFTPSVELKDLCFDYGENKSVFKSLNLIVHPGEFVGIIGPSGSGKSTILDLIIGIQVPTQGEVKLSGMVPVDAIKRFSGFISYVPQQTFITQGTVAENIAFGIDSGSINEAQLWGAITCANLEEWVKSLPKGLHEVLYENGKNLSGGQRQRIGIARALYSDPKLILLDESTSSLDADSELEVLNWIKSLKGKKTIISVTHKLSTVRDADMVLNLEADNYTFGTFEEIMELKRRVK
jgi:ABC-type multidrug transport system fused ATPase/permease subunit